MPTTGPVRTGFRAFVERHDQLFTVLGALIVFLGFYVREVRLENTISLDGSLKAAIAEANFNRTTQELDDNINQTHEELNDEISSVSTRLDRGRKEGPGAAIFFHECTLITESSSNYDAAKDQLKVAKKMLADFPVQSTGLNAEASKLEADTSTLDTEQQQVLDARVVVTAQDIKAMTNGNEPDSQKNMLQAAGKFNPVADAFVKAVSKLERDAHDEGDKQLQQFEAESDHAKQFSYLLFGVGWFLGLAGKLLKIPALGGDSD